MDTEYSAVVYPYVDENSWLNNYFCMEMVVSYVF